MRSNNDSIQIGDRIIWGGTVPFELRAPDRRHHLYLIGMTGAGKTTLLQNLIVQDIDAGRGVAVIDPHGDLADALLDHIPRRRTEDVVYFDPADVEHPIGLNILRSVFPESRHLAASGIVSALKGVWRESWGPRLEYILYAATAALLEVENSSLLGLQRMLADSDYRAWIVRQVKDPVIAAFWKDEFANYDERFMREAVAPIQNKVGQLLMAPAIRNILGQVRSRINPRFVMDRGRIFIANLSKGRLGEDKSNLVGALLVNQFQLAAMSRATLPESERRDFHLYVDEFQNFASDAFASILSEARKFRLCLTLSHQYTAQLRPEVRDAIFGNVGTLISLRVGEADAALLERQFGQVYPAKHFTELGNYEAVVKLLDGGEHGDPFLGKMREFGKTPHGRRYKILKRSRERYATPRSVIEDKINRWLKAR